MSRIEDAAIAFVAIIESSGYCLDDTPAGPEYDALHAAVNSADPVATALAALGEAAVEWDAAPLAETNRVTFALIGAVKAYGRARKGER